MASERESLRAQYVIFDDGSVRATYYEGDQGPKGPRLPAPGRVVTEEEYLEARDAIRAANAAETAVLLATEQERLRADYEVLRAAGLSEATARRMSGFTAAEEAEEG